MYMYVPSAEYKDLVYLFDIIIYYIFLKLVSSFFNILPVHIIYKQ